ncbi:hypothetical protein [Desulfobulbus oligotrophicus]|uniref:Uncharacterized protein n=1 Tax=Desulfobulbus oligotrophicus TaxID=1909699 RepID=A0A7T6APK7_9BACT|nr:hypothetical protein [Desulfobulbus oligotrophicus]QQG64642.1 hypothetical protein HP555_01575 [Desulfobulbus oligotrophicus]
MAIALEFIDFVVPISVIREKYPEGWEQCLKDHRQLIGGRVWFDAHLFRDGAMNPLDIKSLLEEWTALGFEPTEKTDGQLFWKDCCVIESLFGGPTRPCSWIAMGDDGRSAYLKGTEPGNVIGRPPA